MQVGNVKKKMVDVAPCHHQTERYYRYVNRVLGQKVRVELGST